MSGANGNWSAVPEARAGRAPLGPRASESDGGVIGMGAICDVSIPWNQSTGAVSLALSEYLELESGKRVVLHNDRGVTIGARGGSSGFATDEILELCLGALLPDEGEEPGEPHPWSWLAELAAEHGIDVTPETLKSLPYHIELRPAVEALTGQD